MTILIITETDTDEKEEKEEEEINNDEGYQESVDGDEEYQKFIDDDEEYEKKFNDEQYQEIIHDEECEKNVNYENYNEIIKDYDKDENFNNSESNNSGLIVIRSNKGGDKLCLNGYMYILHRNRKDGIRWRCTKHSLKSFECKGAIITTTEKTNPIEIVEHNHVADIESIKKDISMNRMKSKARYSFTKPSQIFAEEIKQLPKSTRARLPLEESVKRTLRNQRSIKIIQESPNLEDLIIEDEWMMTGGAENQRFLLLDNRRENEISNERIIIFATDKFLKLLDDANEWYIDINNDIVPKDFLQLCVIRVSINSIFITIAYAILEKKSETTYTYMLKSIIEKCAEIEIFPDPQIIYTEFDTTIINSVRQVFGDEIKIQGCFYHLAQSNYKKIQDLKLTKLHKENENFNKFCSMIDGLAFLPINDIGKGMKYLRKIVDKSELNEANILLNYFDENYVNGSSRKIGKIRIGNEPIKKRRISAKFPIDSWNLHDSMLNNKISTKNIIESWNNRFEYLVEMSHPTIWTLIENMKREVAVDTTKILQTDIVGFKKSKTKKSKIEEREDNLIKLCHEYVAGEKSVKKFLKAVSHAIRFRRI